jgi:hypothetical protein
MNGAGPPDDLPRAPQQMPIERMIALLDPAVSQVIGTMVRGLLVSAPGCPPHVILNLIAWKTGHFLADAVKADLSALLMLRKGIKDAFDDGIKKTPMSHIEAPMPPSETTLADRLRRN